MTQPRATSQTLRLLAHLTVLTSAACSGSADDPLPPLPDAGSDVVRDAMVDGETSNGQIPGDSGGPQSPPPASGAGKGGRAAPSGSGGRGGSGPGSGSGGGGDEAGTAGEAVGGSGGDTGSGGTHAAADGSYQATQLAVGEDHSCAVLTTGQVACWGSNTFGQLGDGSDRVLRRPYAAVIEGLTNVVSISASEYLTCALDAEHHVYCWGLAGVQSDLQPRSWDAPTRVEPLDDATAIATGAAHACALVSGGRVVCWGSNEHGKLGDGMTAPDATSFQDAPVTVKELDGVTALAAGRAHTCARSGSTVRCWGNNANGELSTGIASQSAVPISVGEVPGATTLSAALATFITLQSGDVSCWGLGTGGLLIDPEADFTKPRALGLDHVELTAVGPSAVCTLRSLAADNGIVACRALSDTKLNWAPATRWESLVLPAGSRVVNIAVGDHHACAALSGGGVQCWGSNGAGELGDTTFTSSRTARHVAGF